MDSEIAGNQNYDDHYANNCKDVHSALLPLHDGDARCARAMYQPLFIGGSVRRRPRCGNVLLSPTPISPIATPTEEQEEHENNKNEVHIFLQNI